MFLLSRIAITSERSTPTCIGSASHHFTGSGVLRPSGGANAVAGCWPTIRPSGFRDPWAFLITYVVKLPTRRLLHTKRGTLRTCEAEACDSPPRKTDLVSKTVQLSYLDGEIIVGSRDYP